MHYRKAFFGTVFAFFHDFLTFYKIDTRELTLMLLKIYLLTLTLTPSLYFGVHADAVH